MATVALWLKIEEKNLVPGLIEAEDHLDTGEGEIVLDISSVGRVDSAGIMALEKFANLADDQGVRVGLCGVNVDVYKVLKLVRLSNRFSFVS